jgi:hypothetical protein
LGDSPLSESALEAAILKTLDGPGREADASALKHMLVGCEAVRAIRNGSGVVYQRASVFPSWPETGPGSASWDEHLAELAAQEQADHDRVAAEVERNSPQNRQRLELDSHIRQVVREAMRDELDRVREDLQRHLSRLVRQAVDEQGLRVRAERAIDKTSTGRPSAT